MPRDVTLAVVKAVDEGGRALRRGRVVQRHLEGRYCVQRVPDEVHETGQVAARVGWPFPVAVLMQQYLEDRLPVIAKHPLDEIGDGRPQGVKVKADSVEDGLGEVAESLAGGEPDDQRDGGEDGLDGPGTDEGPDVGGDDAAVVDRRTEGRRRQIAGRSGRPAQGRGDGEYVLVGSVLKALDERSGSSPPLVAGAGAVECLCQSTGVDEGVGDDRPRTEGGSTLKDDALEEMATWENQSN